MPVDAPASNGAAAPVKPSYAPPIPAAVKAAGAQADAIQQDYIRQMNGEEPPRDPNEEDEQPDGEQQPQEGDEQPIGDPPYDAQQEQQFEQGQPPQPQEEDIPEESWRHRYLSMQGRYQAEVPKLRNQVSQLLGQVNNLNRLLATVSQPPAPQPREATFKSSVKPEEIAEYGPDFVDLVGRIVKDTTAGQQADIKNLKGQVQHVGKQIGANARERMMAQLAERVPNWEEINTHQDFLDWLVLPDVYSGDIRHNMLNAAFERNDAPRVIAFFEGFLAEMAAVAPPEAEPSRQPVKLARTPLRNLAAPGRARSTAPAPPRPVEKPIITASQISKFYTEKGLGKWKGREREAAEVEAQIFAAQAEGRIR